MVCDRIKLQVYTLASVIAVSSDTKAPDFEPPANKSSSQLAGLPTLDVTPALFSGFANHDRGLKTFMVQRFGHLQHCFLCACWQSVGNVVGKIALSGIPQ
jgi:hypothetical protein